MALFQNSVRKKYISHQAQQPMMEGFEAYRAYFHNPHIHANIRAAKEEQFQEGFLRELFVNILGYTINPNPEYNLTTELKNSKDARKTDGAILVGGNALAVIELKGTDTKDLEKIRDQAFNYKNNQPKCIYVITSNFEKLRFYIDNAVDYVEFNLFGMQWEDFKLFWLILQKDNLLGGIPKKIKEESLLAEEQITKQLYADYSSFKQQLWQNMVALNPGQDELDLYKKSQKLLDRFLFIFFAEDKGLLPPNSIMEIVGQWKKLTELDEYRPLYERFKKYFGYLNTGRVMPGKAEIHAYNGGLFAPDPVLDGVLISDDVLEKHVQKLTEYDFESEVDTNILGHIFEHSLNDIENVRAQLAGQEVDRSKTKRKRDGVFYTPKYITKYIVDNSLGRLCREKKTELEIVDEDFAEGKRGRKKKTIQKLKTKLDDYRNWLLQLTVCDPACGSGAFLNQVLEYLKAEHHYVDELESQLFDSPLILPNVENHILENNIFGVDINEESVEIARLSLWLRTAKKGRKLSSLNANIKVGNSLIDDPVVAGDLAFNWQEQFPQVFAKGGFDVVVGNPPYVDLKGLDNGIVDFIFKNYKTSNNRVNLYSTFVEKSQKIINRRGRLSFIIPSSILTQSSYKDLRSLLLKTTSIENIVRLPNESFGGSAGEVKVDTIIITFLNRKVDGNKTEIIIYKGFDRISEISRLNSNLNFEINQKVWQEDGESVFKINSNSESEEIIKKIEINSIHLVDCADFCLGLTPYDKYKGHSPENISNRIFHSTFKKDASFQKLLAGNDIRRYYVEWGGDEWISYGDWLGAPRESKYFTKKRILVKQIIDWSDKRIWAALTEEELYNTQNAFNLLPKPNFKGEYLVALINSRLISFYHKKKFLEEFKDRFQKILIKDAKLFPIKEVDLEYQDFFSALVDSIISKSKELKKLISNLLNLLKSKFNLTKLSTKLQNWHTLDFNSFLGELKKAKVKLSLSEEAEWMAYFDEQKAKAKDLQAEINGIDREIDALVYELYGLTDEEIGIVEGGVG